MPTKPKQATDTLAERVYNVLTDRGFNDDVLGVPGRQPELGDDLSDFELNLREWGFAAGVAYTLTRLEADPFERHEQTAERAYIAAWSAWTRYSDGFGEREANGQAIRLARIWGEAKPHIDGSPEHPSAGSVPPELWRALDELSEQVQA